MYINKWKKNEEEEEKIGRPTDNSNFKPTRASQINCTISSKQSKPFMFRREKKTKHFT